MSRNLGRMWIVVFALGVSAFVPLAMAQDMVGGAVTDPPAPVADGVVTLTGTYTNMGPAEARTTFTDYFFGIQPETWADEGFNAMAASGEFTDSNGNQGFIYVDGSLCSHWVFELGQPSDAGDLPMYPIPAGEGGTWSFQLPVIPMEGVDVGRVMITEPEALRNSYEVNIPQYNPPYHQVWAHGGDYNLVSTGALCDEVANCEDLDACVGARIWNTPPFEGELEIVQGTDGDPTLGCGADGITGFTAGKIALARRGVCNFTEKAINAELAGATALILANDGRCSDEPSGDPDECILTMGGDAGLGYLINIPFVLMGRRQGEELFTAIQGGETVRAAIGAIPGDSVDIYPWPTDDDDPTPENNLTVVNVPLGPMGPSQYLSFVPAAAYAAGAQGAFFQTDLDINNKGTSDATVTFGWLPRGADNSQFTTAESITLGAGMSMQYENVLNAVFGAEADVVGGMVMITDSPDVIGMSRTYNVPGGKVAGTFGQALPAVPADQFIMSGEKQRIIFMSENDDIRANVGCINGLDSALRINIELFDAAGTSLETKTMDLPPWSNNQINRVFRDYGPVNGYVDVWTDTAGAAFYCYGSVLDNQTSDPTTVLPQVPSDTMTFIPAAAVAAGAQGAFFQTDVDLNNAGSDPVQYQFLWLPRGADNSSPTASDTFTLGAGMGVRYENVLTEVFDLQPDTVGALALSADTMDLLAMTRTYNIPGVKVAGTFGQALPGVPMNQMIQTGVTKRIIFMNENDDTRANVGCVNGVDQAVRVAIDLYDADGQHLETKTMDLGPWSNNQINRVFRDYAPVNGYVDVSTTTADAYFYCYGSVLDNLTSDPTTVLPQ
jgi:hypothetical protein